MAADDDEDDYMTMVVAEEPKPQKETALQRRARKQSEHEERGRFKTKKQLMAEEVATREAGLSTALDSSNKGFKMMAKLGFKQGDALGKAEDARKDPINVELRQGRGGIGLDSEKKLEEADKKRKIQEEFASEAKRQKADEGEYRQRVRAERETKRLEGQVVGAQKVADGLDTGTEDNGDGKAEAAKVEHQPLKSVNVLWRGLIRHRLEKERETRMRNDLLQSLSRLPTYDDPTEDEDDKRALGKTEKARVYEEEIEEEDPELADFNALEPAERLAKLVAYMRDKHQYCFWCKSKYPDAEMEGCPGVTEEDHD